MKDSLFIDNGLSVNIWANAIDTANYFYNRLSTKRIRPAFISEEAWTNTRQNLEYIRIFRNRVSIIILSEKRIELDVQKTWKDIFIGYTGMSKQLRV